MGRIRNSAKALIIKDGKMAAIKIRDAGEEWYIMPGGGGEMDFTNPYPITVVDALGNKHHNTIRVVPTPPKTKYAKLWEKNAALLNI